MPRRKRSATANGLSEPPHKRRQFPADAQQFRPAVALPAIRPVHIFFDDDGNPIAPAGKLPTGKLVVDGQPAKEGNGKGGRKRKRKRKRRRKKAGGAEKGDSTLAATKTGSPQRVLGAIEAPSSGPVLNGICSKLNPEGNATTEYAVKGQDVMKGEDTPDEQDAATESVVQGYDADEQDITAESVLEERGSAKGEDAIERQEAAGIAIRGKGRLLKLGEVLDARRPLTEERGSRGNKAVPPNAPDEPITALSAQSNVANSPRIEDEVSKKAAEKCPNLSSPSAASPYFSTAYLKSKSTRRRKTTIECQTRQSKPGTEVAVVISISPARAQRRTERAVTALPATSRDHSSPDKHVTSSVDERHETAVDSPSRSSPSASSSSPPPRQRRKRYPTVSPHFQIPKPTSKPRVPAGVSSIPWPSKSSPTFGLIQETLADNPFQLLVATVFLNKTRASVAIPVLRKYLELYPTPEAVLNGDTSEMVSLIACLGLQNTRTLRLKNLAEDWIAQPPIRGKRSGRRGLVYPSKGVNPLPVSEEMTVIDGGEDDDGKYEIGHLRGIGPYSIDSWRIFCRDRLLGRGNMEWRSVVPLDKELRVYVRWKWWKEEGLLWREEGDEWREGGEVDQHDAPQEGVEHAPGG